MTTGPDQDPTATPLAGPAAQIGGSDPFGGLSDELVAAIERVGPRMGPRELLQRVGELVGETGELLTPETAALVVLDELGLSPEAHIVAPQYARVLAPDELEDGLDGVIVEGQLLGIEPTRTFTRRDGSIGFVTSARVRGVQGVYEVTLWDEHIQALVGSEPGTEVRLDGLYTKERRGRVEVHTGRDARVVVVSDTPHD